MISIVSATPLSLDTIERMAIEQTLAAFNNHKDKASLALEIPRQTFWRKLHTHGIFEKYKAIRKSKAAPAVKID